MKRSNDFVEIKGRPDIYNKACELLGDVPFAEWKFQNPTEFERGQFCTAVAIYEKRKRWYLKEHEYKSRNEPESTWYARELVDTYPPEPSYYVMKYFGIAKDERLITTNGKNRPLILLRKAICDWWNPINKADHITYWLCLPTFRYKGRHNQEYVLRDQKLQNPDAFYIPPEYGNYPGIEEESVARFQAIQMINEIYLEPSKCLCENVETVMHRPFKLTKLGLELLLYHFYISLGVFKELKDPQAAYQLFKEQINKFI